MTAFIRTALTGSLLCLLVVLGCDSSTDSPGTGSAAGTWKGKVSDSTMTMVLKPDLAFTTVLPDQYGTYSLAGTYAVQGAAITLTYTSALQGTEGIPPPASPASGTFSGTSMTIPIPYNYTDGKVTLKKQ